MSSDTDRNQALLCHTTSFTLKRVQVNTHWFTDGVTDMSSLNGSPAARKSKCPRRFKAMRMEVDLFY